MKRFLTIATITIVLMTLASRGNRGQKTDTDTVVEACDTVVDAAVTDTVVVE